MISHVCSVFCLIVTNLSLSILKTLCSTVPTGPPQSLRPTRITTSEVILEWDEVSCLDQNGLIQEYQMRYFPTENPLRITTLMIITRVSSISGLESGTSYTFEVAALFGSNTGPFSTLIAIIPSVTNSSRGCQDGELRLVGGMNDLEGRLEICYVGIWGTVCNDGWGFPLLDRNAKVACRQLGHSDSSEC